MVKYFKPISISLSPNVQKDDLALALNIIIRPWLWKNGKAIKALEEKFKEYLGVKYAFSFNSGRSSLFAILQSLDIEKGSEVLLQAFTCNAVPNPILWSDLVPIYVDCNKDDFNIHIDDLKAKIGLKSKAIIVQHTFGLPANIAEITGVCEQNNIILIEDCAHALGAEFNGKKVGTFGKVSFFSFSRDKVISSVYGGMAATNDPAIAKKLEKLQKDFNQPNLFWIFQQIFHPIFLNYIVLPIYNFFDSGKIFLIISQIFGILSKAVSLKEKRGERPDYFPKALPNALAMMAANQFDKLEKFNQRRYEISEYYYNNLRETKFQLPEKFSERKNIFLRFTIKHKDAHAIIYKAWHKENILLGDWYTAPIAPDDTQLNKIHYIIGMCRNAEELSKTTLNLPTHINIKEKDLERISTFLKSFN